MPDRIFSVALHPGGEKLVAAAGDKWGKVVGSSTINTTLYSSLSFSSLPLSCCCCFYFCCLLCHFCCLRQIGKQLEPHSPPPHHQDDFHLLKLFTGSNQVGLWDCLDTESETHGVHLFHYHSRYGANRNMYISSFTATLCGPKKSISQLSCVFPGQ